MPDMKVLLAPLFFQRRMCKHCAKIYYRENPGSWLGLNEFESLPSLGTFDDRRGFIPDFPALLMFDEFAIDAEAYDRLKNPGERQWLREWTELVDALKSQGALAILDVKGAASTNPHKRSWMLRRDMEYPQKWWQAMGYFDNISARAEKFLGDNPRRAKNFAWNFNPDQQYGIEGNDGHVHDLSMILREASRERTGAHRKLYTHALVNLQGHLREVNACITACDKLGVAPMMWAPYPRYLLEKLGPDNDQAVRAADAGRRFFKIAFPAYTPTNVQQFSKLRSDKRINALRSEISRATKDGRALEPRYPQRVLSEVLKLEQKAGRIRSIIGWISTAAGTIPVPGLGLAATAISEGASALVTRHLKKSWHWFYLISDGRGAT